MGLMPGCDIPRPNMVKRDELGTGGNGTVFKQYIGGQEYAIKRVRGCFSALAIKRVRGCFSALAIQLDFSSVGERMF